MELSPPYLPTSITERLLELICYCSGSMIVLPYFNSVVFFKEVRLKMLKPPIDIYDLDLSISRGPPLSLVLTDFS